MKTMEKKDSPMRKRKILGIATAAVMVAGISVGLAVTGKMEKKSPETRHVLQCRLNSRGGTRIKNIELSPEEARNTHVEGDCKIKRCKVKHLGTFEKKFYDCEPLTEEMAE